MAWELPLLVKLHPKEKYSGVEEVPLSAMELMQLEGLIAEIPMRSDKRKISIPHPARPTLPAK